MKVRRNFNSFNPRSGIGETLFLAGLTFVAVGAIIFGWMALISWVVMLLWNAVIPTIFGLTTISFWQSMGLVILTSLLFKNGNSMQAVTNKLKEHNES